MARKKRKQSRIPFGISRREAVATFILASLSLAALILTNVGSARGQRPIDPSRITGEYDSTDTRGEFYGKKVIAANTLESSLADEPTLSSDKRIEVDLTNQRVYAYEGDTKVYDFLVSTGKWGRTPTGRFRIWGKFKATKMSGGSRALRTYYYLPNVPFVMFFSNTEIAASRGFSLHGTYWHDNFGHPMSHGCINMRTEEAELLYYWSAPVVGEEKSTRATKDNQGTEVIIYGVAPKE